MKKARIVLADDHAMLRKGVKHLIEAEADLEVVGEATDGTEVVPLVAKLKPDIVVMDLSMPRMDGAEAIRRLRNSNERCRVLVLSVHEDRNYLREVLEAGALGYMLKRSSGEELINAIRAISLGTVYIDSRIANKAISVMVDGRSEDVGSDEPKLTDREFDVLRHIAEGFSNKEIAALLKVSIKTIETYKARAMEKLGINSRVDIVRMARDRSWPPVE